MKSVKYTIILLMFNFHIKSQVLFFNNPSNHIVAYNPAFSAINSEFNRNYLPQQQCVSFRSLKNQNDFFLTSQYFFKRKNIGVSAAYNNNFSKTNQSQTINIGGSYHLIFFNKISTGWGLGLSLNDTKIYSEGNHLPFVTEITDTLRHEQGITFNFGTLVNFNEILFGYSFQPKVNYFLNQYSRSNRPVNTFILKHRRALTRTTNVTIWATTQISKLEYYYSVDSKLFNKQLINGTLNFHFSGREGILGGFGVRITNFDYISLIAKLGYNFENFQILFGAEQFKYSTINYGTIYEFSLIYKTKWQ